MNCPVCNRDMVASLSICPSCGAMKDDSVRIEVQSSIISSGRLEPAIRNIAALPKLQPMVQRTNPYSVPPPAGRNTVTSSLSVAKTSPTLVEFQTKTTSMPDWRLQIQNAVRQRKGVAPISGGTAIAVAPTRPQLAPLQQVAIGGVDADPRLGNALKRIEVSQNTFGKPEPVKPAFAPRVSEAKNFPFDVVAPLSATPAAVSAERASIAIPTPKPVLVSTPVIAKRITNRLPQLPSNAVESIDRVEPIVSIHETTEPEFDSIKRIFIAADGGEEVLEKVGSNEIEDLAPFSMRFNAGLFDLIIGIVVSLILLSPLMLTGNNWATISGSLILVGTCAIVLFAYLTATIGIYGKTFGMRLFSLEMVDAEENIYPTMNQAAVNSAIYLLSMAFGGVGFLTMFFNEENRAAQDLMSGTIIVREF